jgi:hypothetical protein
MKNKNFYEMLKILEDQEEINNQPLESPSKMDSGDVKNYMFFSNLKSIKEKIDKLLSMDVNQIDSMLEDGHDWASDHISTSRDDIEEVYNWITGEHK